MLTSVSLERDGPMPHGSRPGFAHSAPRLISACWATASDFENVTGELYAEHVLTFDPSQQRALSLDPAQHARVLGAPGSGKTTLIPELWKRLTAGDWDDEALLVLAPNRRVAGALRQELERRLDRAIAGTPVRTPASLAFAVLQRHAALTGRESPRLLTGTAQDDAVERVISDCLEGSVPLQHPLPFLPEVVQGAAFRAELREFSRVCDDYNVADSAELLALLSAREPENHLSARESDDLTDDMRERWLGAAELLDHVRARLRMERPGELPSSTMLRDARHLILNDDELTVPKLILIDDAGELGEGALALVAALAERGTAVWVFGDPDISTSAFQGERTRVLADLAGELQRRGANGSSRGPEQVVVLDQVYRHGSRLRALIQQFSGRVGAAGAGQQRGAPSAHPGLNERHDVVRFATVGTGAEQLGAIAHHLRARHLGLGNEAALAWSRMAVLCRTRGEVQRVSRALAGLQVPSETTAGGVILREHELVRDLVRMLQHALGIAPLDAHGVMRLLRGPLGGLDPIALRRLRAALRLQAARDGRLASHSQEHVDELVMEGFQFPGQRPIVDMRAARRLRALGVIAAEAQRVHEAGGTPREVLWQIWQRSELPAALQEQALNAKGARREEANTALDGVLGLFFALQRHEEHDSERPIDAVLTELVTSTVPEDSLAAKSARDVVTVTTPQGAIGQQFDLVCIVGPQDGEWPNLRTRGSLLGVTALERLLRDGQATMPSRRDTLHDELRLFVHALSRSRGEVLVVAVKNEDQHPSVFFSLGHEHHVERDLPSSRLTLRGVVAEMRRRLVRDPADAEALTSLVELAEAGVPGAHPDDWYGVRPPSTHRPLADIAAGDTVRVSPSQLQQAETCPLNWFVSTIGGFTADYRANVGTLLHRALETAGDAATAEMLREAVFSHWPELQFEANWQSERARQDTEHMVRAVATYLSKCSASDRTLVAREATFEVAIEFARLRGIADRIEAVKHENGALELRIVDLKTGRTAPTKAEVADHAQLQAYQLGAQEGAFLDHEGNTLPQAAFTSASLLYVHPDTLSATQRKQGESYVEYAQQGLTAESRETFIERVLATAHAMAGSSFVAQVEHHCSDPYAIGAGCALHIIPAVSAS